MKLARPRLPLGLRIILSSTAIVVATAMATILLIGSVAVRATAERSARDRQPRIRAELERCRNEPSTFVVEDDGHRVWAYDQAGQSRNPNAPPLDLALLAEARETGHPAHHIDYTPPLDGRFVMLEGDAGPCSVTQVEWRIRPDSASALDRRTLGLVLLSVLVASGLAMAAVVVPVASRLRRLERATRNVGNAEAYASAGDAVSDPIGAVSAALDDAHHRLVAAQARDRAARDALEHHLADIAHDVRTPLAALQLRLERLRVEPDAIDTTVRGCLDDLAYTTSLIENLRMAARLRDGAEIFVSFDWRDIVERVRGRFHLLGAMHDMRVDASYPDEPVFALGDPAMAEQSLANVVHNAVRYASSADAEGQIIIALEASDDRFVLAVHDDGPGVSAAELPRLGERTFRTDEARTRSQSGSGLGLAIVAETSLRCGWSNALTRSPLGGLLVRVEGPRVSGPGSVKVRTV